jgi:hypothetical protein
LSTGPKRMSRQSLFEISFEDGGPAQGESDGVEVSEVSDVEVTGAFGVSGAAVEFAEPPLSIADSSALRTHEPLPPATEPPRLAPDPDRPAAVTIDAGSGTIWHQIGAKCQSPAEARAAAVLRHQDALAQRRREHELRNEQEAEQARADARIREQRMRSDAE